MSNRVIQDLSNILSNIYKNGLLVISEPHNKSIFSKKLMDDKNKLKRKLKILKKTRQEIKYFLKDCQKNEKASIIIEEETKKRYFVIMRKN